MKNAVGYILGFLLFVAGIPALMWWASGRPFPWVPDLPWPIIAMALVIPGLALQLVAAPRLCGRSDTADTSGPFRGEAPGGRLWRRIRTRIICDRQELISPDSKDLIELNGIKSELTLVFD